jgi:protein gp37
MGNTLIDWTDKVWNPCTGCEKIAPECRECYAEGWAKRLQAMGNPRYVNGFKVTLHPQALKEPFGWKGNVMCFLPSMGDLFHDDVPDDFVDSVLAKIDANIDATTDAESAPKTIKIWRWVAAAAGIALIVGIGALMMTMGNDAAQPIASITE